MKKAKKLRLARETLRALSTSDLATVAGGTEMLDDAFYRYANVLEVVEGGLPPGGGQAAAVEPPRFSGVVLSCQGGPVWPG